MNISLDELRRILPCRTRVRREEEYEGLKKYSGGCIGREKGRHQTG